MSVPSGVAAKLKTLAAKLKTLAAKSGKSQSEIVAEMIEGA